MSSALTSEWPHGTGEMAARIRSFDWKRTSLGPVEMWPLSLRFTLATILEHPLSMALCWGPDLITLHNDAYGRLLRAKPEALGRPFLEVWAEARDTILPEIERTLAGETIRRENAPFRIRREEHPEEAFFDYALNPVRDDTGLIAGMLTTAFETTSRVLAERQRTAAQEATREGEGRQTFLLELSDALRPLADPVAMQEVATRLLGRHLDVSRCLYAEFIIEGGEETVVIEREYRKPDAPSFVGRHRADQFGPDVPDLRAGRVIAVADTEAASTTDGERAVWQAIEVRSRLGVPLIKAGRLVAGLGMQNATPRAWTAGDIALVQGVAERTWAAVERARAEAALRESEARLAAAFQSVPAGVASIDIEGRIIVANSEYRRYLPTGIMPSRDPDRGGRWQAWDPQGQVLAPQDYPGARAVRGETTVPGQDMLYSNDDGCDIWTNVATAPTFSDAGHVTGFISVISNIDERKRSVEALRQSEERFQQFSEASPDILWARNAKTLQWDYLSPAFEEVYGLSRQAALDGNDFRRWLKLVEPQDRHDVLANTRRVREGKRVTFEFRIRRPVDGQVRWLRNTDFPIRNQNGRVHRIGGVGQDVTELKAIEAALTHSERRLRTLVEGMSQLVWRAIDNGDWTWASPQWTAFTGQAEPDSHHLGWLEPVHSEDRDTAMAAWAHALETGGFTVEFRLRNASTGAYRWFQTRAAPVRDARGEITEWLGTSTDIHDLRTMQDRQQVLLAELQHRTRNLMSVVRATADNTLRSSTDLADFGARYRDRLDALARVQGVLSRLEGLERITFDELIRSELKAIGAINGTMGKVSLAGPDGVALRSSTVQTFALALHELATNAVKYGALTAPSGHLAVTWRLENEQPANIRWLYVDWHESGVAMPPADAPPQGTGHGRRLIERALPYQLGARTTYVMGLDGVRCSIAVPVSNRTAVKDLDDLALAPS